MKDYIVCFTVTNLVEEYKTVKPVRSSLSSIGLKKKFKKWLKDNGFRAASIDIYNYDEWFEKDGRKF